MLDVEEQWIALTRKVVGFYFVSHEYELLTPFISKQISWIGTLEDEICHNKDDILYFFNKEYGLYKDQYKLSNEQYHAVKINNQTGIVWATLNINAPDLPNVLVRLSVVWGKEDGEWKIFHVHNSIPDHIQGEYYFNIENAKVAYQVMDERVKLAATTDSVTHIKNRNGFCNAVSKLMHEHRKQNYALIKFKVQNFRYINQRYGYSNGDRLLENIAKNVKRSCNQEETCGRIEKDTFAILYQFEDRESLNQRLYQLNDDLIDKRMKRKMFSEVHLLIGVYLIPQNSKESIPAMLDKALIALNQINETQREKNILYYQEEMMKQQYHNNFILEQALIAFEKDEFKLFIQPQFDIESGKTVAGEALTRWITKSGEMIMPNEFIPLFEQHGFICEFDFYMLEKLCQTLRHWMDAGMDIQPISINQSRLHISEPDYLERFCHIVDTYSIPHCYITFELTESAFVEENERMLTLASQLHQMGFQLAIDDFGTGYASLSLLSVVSADILKIDKSLLDGSEVNQRSYVILEKVIEMAHDMGMIVVTEGIETRKQLDFLRELHCDIGQGYLISRPIAADEFKRHWLSPVLS